VNDPNGAIKKYEISGILNASVSNAGPVPKKNAIKIVLIWKKNRGIASSICGWRASLTQKAKKTPMHAFI
jgi:hypothetical protein